MLYNLLRDGQPILSGVSHVDITDYIHRIHCYSLDHATAHEGYAVEPALPTMYVQPTDHNPAMDGGETMDHWRCTLRYAGRRMSLVYSMGSGHNGKEPQAKAVLECLFLDASGIDSARDFSDWCFEYGYDTDSRRAERIYKACQSTAVRLRKLLGDDYDAIRNAIEGEA
jgi:hypothetical protein